MRKLPKPLLLTETDDAMFDQASALFRLLATPMRLRILKALCEGEKNVTELLSRVNTTQPNMSQHLNVLFNAGILSKRREGVQIYYDVADKRILELCRVVCTELVGSSASTN